MPIALNKKDFNEITGLPCFKAFLVAQNSNLVGVTIEECQEIINNNTPTNSAAAGDVNKHYISGDQIVWYDGTSSFNAVGNCTSSSASPAGPIGGVHDAGNYSTNGGCYSS